MYIFFSYMPWDIFFLLLCLLHTLFWEHYYTVKILLFKVFIIKLSFVSKTSFLFLLGPMVLTQVTAISFSQHKETNETSYEACTIGSQSVILPEQISKCPTAGSSPLHLPWRTLQPMADILLCSLGRCPSSEFKIPLSDDGNETEVQILGIEIKKVICMFSLGWIC